MKLTNVDYNMSCRDLAKFLLGKTLVRRLEDGTVLKGMIVETECYPGGSDKASHSYNGRKTIRNEPMYMKPGTIYVYMTYGMYHCLNISSKGDGAAVLLRALEPLQGHDIMAFYRQQFAKNRKKTPTVINRASCLKAKDLCNGPSKLCISLQIDKKCSGNDLSFWDGMWIEADEAIPPDQIVQARRIGINSSGTDAVNKLYRFYIKDNEYVSKK